MQAVLCVHCVTLCDTVCEEGIRKLLCCRRDGASLTCGEDVAVVLGPLPTRHTLLEALPVEDHPRAAWPREAE